MENEGIGSLIAEGLGSTPAPAAPVTDPNPAPAASAPAPAETPAAPVADAAPATPAIAVPSAPVALSPAPAAEAPKHEAVPLPVFLDMRDENKRLKAELAKRGEAQPPTPVQVPSFKDDPDGLAAYLAENSNRVAVGTRFDVSELTAREKHGDEAVTAAMDWGMQRSQESPAFAAEYLKQKNPIDWAVKQMKRAKLLDEIGDDEEKFFAARAEKLGYVKAPVTAPAAAAPAAPATPQPQAPAPAQPQPAAQAAPTRSLASAPSAGGPAIVPAGDFAAFDALPIGR